VKIPGRGMSTPIVWENQVFLQTAIPTGKKVEAPAAQKPAAAIVSPNVFGQAQAPAVTPPPDGQQRRRPGGGGGGFGRGGGGFGGGFGGFGGGRSGGGGGGAGW